jgi:hypothetical protein
MKVFDAKDFHHISDVRLNNHKLPAQIFRFTPDGTQLLASSFSEPLLRIMPADDLNSQQTLAIGEGPMDMAFDPNGETVWGANHNAGTISVVWINPLQELHRFSVGKGVETLEFYDREGFRTALGPHHPANRLEQITNGVRPVSVDLFPVAAGYFGNALSHLKTQ